MKTWHDLERVSLSDAVIHRALHLHLNYPARYTREEMLIDLVFALKEEGDRYKEQLLYEIQNRACLHEL